MNSDLCCTEYWQKSAESVRQGSLAIRACIDAALQEGKGALIGRHGTIELTCVLVVKDGFELGEDRLHTLERNAGIFPLSAIPQWIEAYNEATAAATALAVGWYAPLARSELKHVQLLNPFSWKLPLRSLEPYYCPDRSWLHALQGQSVCVISSFTETIHSQIPHLKEIWKGHDIFPETIQWTFVRSYYSPSLAQGWCEWPNQLASWKHAVDFMEAEVTATGARVVLLGCGGLAMPLAARLQRNGKICIVLGGAIQILFGIKGKRWEKHPVISQFFNDAWVYPADEEVPRAARSIEGGCYW